MKTLKINKLSNDFSLFKTMTSMQHEQIVVCQDNETGLKAIIAIHDTTHLDLHLEVLECGTTRMKLTHSTMF